MIEDPSLKVCPFCGGEACFQKGYRSRIYCVDCEIGTEFLEDTQAVLAAWNRRVLDDSVKQILRQLGE